jgi:hypothetical protein
MTAEIYYITWLNYLGGFEYFPFTAKKEYQVDVLETAQTRVNIFPNWGNSYGKNADTIDKQTYRTSKNGVIVRSQHLSLNQLEALSYIRTSPLVQLVTTRIDRRTLIVDNDSFKKYDEADKLFTIQFRVLFTDEIPSQKA